MVKKEKVFVIVTEGKLYTYHTVWAKNKKEAEKLHQEGKSDEYNDNYAHDYNEVCTFEEALDNNYISGDEDDMPKNPTKGFK